MFPLTLPAGRGAATWCAADPRAPPHRLTPAPLLHSAWKEAPVRAALIAALALLEREPW
ncbi:MAG: hypothetical protein R3F62_19205 [Planctomycetota bacterium]